MEDSVFQRKAGKSSGGWQQRVSMMILTAHYTEGAGALSDCIGIMKNGNLLDELPVFILSWVL